MPMAKYIAPAPINLPNREWPSRTITKSPIWTSVDLRDGNQALPNPMNPEQKLEYFQMLCGIGFREIEIGFPSASQEDFDFTRKLIEENLIPENVTIMVLTQCRPHLIERTFEAIKGAQWVIFHAYCATSELHMTHVFKMTRESTLEMIVHAIRKIRALADEMPETDVRLEFSPEEFTDTDPEFALQVCEAVFETWGKATA
ncbi:MAG: 2-isopropylmalate synthase, partial [Nanoarchaeota archaeon]|nr:2-isopropylmalate synthase [Nanoarchaeota archaeon]